MIKCKVFRAEEEWHRAGGIFRSHLGDEQVASYIESGSLCINKKNLDKIFAH